MNPSEEEGTLSKRKIIELLKTKNKEEVYRLYQIADKTRKKYMGDEIHLRGIIEFSNYCRRDCLYCGLRRSNARLHRYRMTFSEIFQTALKTQTLNFKTVVLQSGEDPAYRVEDLCLLIKKIKKELHLAITLCIGERPRQEYEVMKEAGADRFLLKHETSDYPLYKRLHPDLFYEDRLKCLSWLKELGYQVGSGNMVGLPGQSVESLAEDILLFKKLDVDMVGIGPFIPHYDTPLRNTKTGSLDAVLKIIAIARIVTKNAHIPATTAVGTIDPLGRQKALQCGANVIMPNITPQKYRRDYQIYPDKICIFEDAEDCHSCIQGMVKSLGRTIASSFGDSLKKRFKNLEEKDEKNIP
ncbi:[FeFe] hydrogenase H-cluster radical SAM maturase HydE [bacterium]|nr:[FeFe] hydrogenase H-cluster radical SAM maturase HydE [bacterium]